MRGQVSRWWQEQGLFSQAVTLLTCSGAVIVLSLVLLGIAGGLETSGATLDWSVVSALAAAVAATFTVIGAVAIGQAAKRFEEDARATRISRQPYIRADIAFADRHEPNFAPPLADHVYSLRELGLYEAAEALVEIDSSDSWNSFDLVLWLTNLQVEPLGIADRVKLNVRLSWQKAGLSAETCAVEIEASYLVHGQTLAISICRPPQSLTRFAAFVLDLTYKDIFDDTCLDCHGAMDMVYDGAEVRNERRIKRKFEEVGITPGDRGNLRHRSEGNPRRS